MNRLAIYSACLLLSLSSSITIAAPGDDLDEVTIGVLGDDAVNSDINEIELPHIIEHESDTDKVPGKAGDSGDDENEADSVDEEDSADSVDSDAEDDREDDQTEANEDDTGDTADTGTLTP